MDIANQAKNHFMEMVKDDYTQLGFLTAFISDNAPDLTDDLLINMTKKIIGELVTEHGIYVVDERTELKSKMSTNQILDEIDSVFAETNGSPRIGDGIWFGVDNEHK